MTIYVHSRGKSQDHDHSWLRDGHTLMMPEELKAIKPEELIESQKPSLILARSGGQLVLLATALTTGDGRTDFMRRQIRNTVAWVESDNRNSEQLLCKIAARALNKDLAGAVDSAVHSDAAVDDCGFRVDFDLLKAIEDSSDNRDAVESHPDIAFKVGNNIPTLREELAKELTNCGLPESTGDTEILVVMTTLKSSDGLKSKNVWRGLSSRINKSEGWEEYTPVKKPRTASKMEVKEKSPILGIIFLLVIGAMLLTIWLLLHNAASQNPKTESVTPVQTNVTSLSQPKTNP